MQIEADAYTPVDATLIPTGEKRPVEGTPFDFRKPVAIGARIDAADEQLKFGRRLRPQLRPAREGGRAAARPLASSSRRAAASSRCSRPSRAIQFYSGNFLDGTVIGKSGKPYVKRGAFCLEAQHFPDSPNHPSFPSVVLRPGETYRQTTVYRFSVVK